VRQSAAAPVVAAQEPKRDGERDVDLGQEGKEREGERRVPRLAEGVAAGQAGHRVHNAVPEVVAGTRDRVPGLALTTGAECTGCKPQTQSGVHGVQTTVTERSARGSEERPTQGKRASHARRVIQHALCRNRSEPTVHRCRINAHSHACLVRAACCDALSTHQTEDDEEEVQNSQAHDRRVPLGLAPPGGHLGTQAGGVDGVLRVGCRVRGRALLSEKVEQEGGG
jgi:hypothetical protein